MRTQMITVVTLLSLILAGTFSAFAEPLPSLKILVPANPGGGWDQTGRAVEQALRAEKLVTGAIRLSNRGGAGGTIGLALGEWTHVGKGATFGLGQYRIEVP